MTCYEQGQYFAIALAMSISGNILLAIVMMMLVARGDPPEKR